MFVGWALSARIEKSKMKNVVLLTIDTLRQDALGCYGNKKGLAPFIDSLQDKCIRFTKGQASGPYTQAAFPGLLTSSYYLEYGKPKGLAPERTLISEPLQKAEIVTAAFHSNPYICGFLGWNRGWDTFYDSMEDEVEPRIPYIRGPVINTKVRNWLLSHVKGGEYKPFFLWLHYMDIHEPYMPEKKYVDMADPSVTISQNEMYSLFENTLLKRDTSDPAKVTLLRKLYDIHVREADSYIQEFFGTLEKLDILKDTVVIITNDHGDEFNEHGGLSHDDKMYSELIDMPLLIYNPSSNKGEVSDIVVSNIDIPPTIIHLFSLAPVEAFEGHSLLPLEDYPRKGVFGEAIDQRSQKGGNMDNDVYYYRAGDLKIIYRTNVDDWEVYDLKEDPKELNNIATVSPEAGELKNKLLPRVRRWVSE
ncbi:MAG: sulfatase [Dehalococcoidales bacterium]|nr:sulfatase [Dehalococcoidales bacterium]